MFQKVLAFAGLGAAIHTPDAHDGVRSKRDFSTPRPKQRRRTAHGKMRLFRSYR
jgi:hypothetical protein